ncbi:hypothetical protein [Actinomadura sp. 3N407]|uniref:hypothetical protein n=1 Tax=Actinomadura sp. 3N407 TaxID=3457423 RepID=UPI003FCCC308
MLRLLRRFADTGLLGVLGVVGIFPDVGGEKLDVLRPHEGALFAMPVKPWRPSRALEVSRTSDPGLGSQPGIQEIRADLVGP